MPLQPDTAFIPPVYGALPMATEALCDAAMADVLAFEGMMPREVADASEAKYLEAVEMELWWESIPDDYEPPDFDWNDPWL